MNLLSSILWRCLRCPTRIAVVDDRRTYSYGRLAAGSFFMADHIATLSRSKNVGLLLPTSGAMPVCILGAWLAERVPVPLNYLLSPPELSAVIEHSDVDTIFTVQPMLDYLGGVDKLPPGIKVVKLETLSFHGLPPLRWPGSPGQDETAVILYTSGTSGKPKGVMLTHGNLYSNVVDAIKLARLSHSDGFLGVLPQFHSFGLMALTLVPLHLGAKVIYTARFLPGKLVELIRQHRPDVFMAVPSMYNALLSVKDATRDDFRSLRLPISGGEPLPEAVQQAYRERFGVELLEGYGLTETSPATSWSTPWEHKPGGVGTLLRGVDVQIIDDDGRLLPRGQEGEIFISGPNIMKGYYKAPDLTAELMRTIEGRRYFRTGDIGRIDDDGYLFITGRKKEAMKIGGLLVFPRGIEEVLNRHPTIKDSAVIGRSDPMRGEVPVAFVELREGERFDEMSIRAFCRQSLAQYKVPREIIRVDALPRNATGKILRRELK
jgi:long-chain acyl-CoA synthetase